MKFNYTILLFLTVLSCNQPQKESMETEKKEPIKFSQALADELAERFETDQWAAKGAIPLVQNGSMTWDTFEKKKDSIFSLNTNRAKEIFKEYGYPGYDLIGKDGENAFWVIVQHADHDVSFQKEVLVALHEQVLKKNASGSHLALLTDRVKINSGEKQYYGTQTRYRKDNGQSYPKPLEDSVNVNKRRAELGMSSLEEYLNGSSERHFKMNEKNMLKKGILKPTFYDLPDSADYYIHFQEAH